MSLKSWFWTRPIRQKLLAIALAVTIASVFVSMTGLIVVEILRFQHSAVRDLDSVGKVVADNLTAAVEFGAVKDATDILRSLRVRPAIRRACVYTAQGALFVQYNGEAEGCPPEPPIRGDRWTISSTIPIAREAQPLGVLWIERDMQDLLQNVGINVIAALAMLLTAVVLAFALSRRWNASITRPISRLAVAARQVGRPDGPQELPDIQVPPDELGDLVTAFRSMLERIRQANLDLTMSNQALTVESQERRRIAAERETLLKREREANRLKDEFLATVSHELRTPLNAIVGWARILEQPDADAEMRQRALSSLLRNAKSQARVIDDLIDISRVVTGKLQVQLAQIDWRTVISSAVEVIRPAADAKQIVMSVRLPTEPAWVLADRDRLLQVVWNLLSNAVKFTPAGQAIDVTLSRRHESYELEVRDNGIGISPEFLPHVFERFRQADGSTTREYGGLGIGLAIVKELVILHGGFVTASSAGLGRGAALRVTLPKSGRLEETGEGDRPAAAISLANIDVLAVDDDPDALEILSLALRSGGARVTALRSAEEAVREWRIRPHDVLLSDIAMPGMNGFDLLADIRAIDAAAGRVTPAIAVTAQASADFAARSIRAGFQQHVVKPYDTQDLLAAVKLAIERV